MDNKNKKELYPYLLYFSHNSILNWKIFAKKVFQKNFKTWIKFVKKLCQKLIESIANISDTKNKKKLDQYLLNFNHASVLNSKIFSKEKFQDSNFSFF